MIENNDIKKQIIKRLMRKDVRTVAVAMHNSYDGDSLGSAVALEKTLIKMGKKVDIIIQNKISQRYSKIIGSNRVNRIIIPRYGRKYDLLILVDCANPDRTVNNIFDLSDFMIVIDHHYGCLPIGDIYLYEDVPACGMIIYNIIKMLEKEDKNILDSDIINALYLSIRSDTNCFKNKNTDSLSHIIAGNLVEAGADIQLINEIYDNRSVNLLRLMGNTFSRVIFDRQYKIIYLIVQQEEIKKSQATYEEVSLLMDYLRDIDGAETAFLFIECNNNVIVKARSKYTNVAEIMNKFEGGGHKNAAGAMIYSNDIYSIAESVVRTAKENIKYA